MEEVDFPTQVSVHTIGDEFLPGSDPAHDLFASAAVTNSRPSIIDRTGVSSPVAGLAIHESAGKIHKLLRVFLI